MAKLVYKQDTDSILERMRIGANLDNAADLAKFMDMTPQAVGNSRARGSISLPFVMKYHDKTGISLDYIVNGIEQKLVSPRNADPNCEEEPLIGVSEDWAKTMFSVAPVSLRSHIDRDGSILLIDTSANARQISEGKYLLKIGSALSIRDCRMKIGGSLVIEGEEKPLTPKEAEKVEVIGRVVWRGARV